jgi:hypothetical protein
MVFIIDEAQNRKLQASDRHGGPYIALFSSFGSPGEIAVQHAGYSAPVQLLATQRITLKPTPDVNFGQYFTKAEYLEVVQCVTTVGSHGQAFLISPETVEFIWELTMGHPGATRAVLDILLHDEVFP